MKTKLFSFLILGGALAFTACDGGGATTTDADGDTNAIERSPDNTTVDANTNPDTSNTTAQGTLDEKSREFVMEAASGGMMEVQLGEMAQQKAMHQRVKNFGAMMVRDHNKASDDLKTTVSGKVTVPSAIAEKHQRHITDLQNKTGAEFDKAYMKMMVDDHQTNIKKFEDISKDSKDPALQSFANNTLPVLRMHLDSAKAIRSALK